MRLGTTIVTGLSPLSDVDMSIHVPLSAYGIGSFCSLIYVLTFSFTVLLFVWCDGTMSRGGNLYHRIRLLPVPVKEYRLLQLLRQADMVLDSFPVGGSFHLLALASSVGTPVITLRTGTLLRTPAEELKEIRTRLYSQQQMQQKQLQQQSHNKTDARSASSSNPLTQSLLASLDVPWLPSLSSIAGFYKQIGLDHQLVANNTHDYFKLATALATDRYGALCRVLNLKECSSLLFFFQT